MDPQYQRYKRTYPTFPGVATCMDLLHRRNVQGAYLDAVIADLERHAAEHSDELISAVQTETDARVPALLPNPEETARFQQMLEEVKQWK